MTTELWHAELKLRALKSLRGHIEGLVGDDEQALKDTIEGAVDLDQLLGALVGLRQEATLLAEARLDLARQYRRAADDAYVRAEKIEGMIFDALTAACQQKWAGPAGTCSIRRGSVSCEITNPMVIPFEFHKSAPDVAAIKEALKGAAVLSGAKNFSEFTDISMPGARLVRGPDTISIRIPGNKDAEQKGS
jgi:hypothetical protein